MLQSFVSYSISQAQSLLNFYFTIYTQCSVCKQTILWNWTLTDSQCLNLKNVTNEKLIEPLQFYYGWNFHNCLTLLSNSSLHWRVIFVLICVLRIAKSSRFFNYTGCNLHNSGWLDVQLPVVCITVWSDHYM